MNILQFLALLAFVADHEIIKPRLPHVPGFEDFFPQPGLLRQSSPAQLGQYAAGKTLLQHLHNRRLRPALRLADQYMHMLGHDYVSRHHETMPHSHLLQNFEE